MAFLWFDAGFLWEIPGGLRRCRFFDLPPGGGCSRWADSLSNEQLGLVILAKFLISLGLLVKFLLGKELTEAPSVYFAGSRRLIIGGVTSLVLPDGPAARGAVPSGRVIRFAWCSLGLAKEECADHRSDRAKRLHTTKWSLPA